MTITTRQMEAADMGRVSKVLTAGYAFIAGPDGFSDDQLDRLLAMCASVGAVRRLLHSRRCFVAERGSALSGVLMVDGDEVTELFVDPAHHREGIGRQLFELAVRLVRSAGHGKLRLVTTGYGIPFYEAMGMSVTGTFLIDKGPLAGRERPSTALELEL